MNLKESHEYENTFPEDALLNEEDDFEEEMEEQEEDRSFFCSYLFLLLFTILVFTRPTDFIYALARFRLVLVVGLLSGLSFLADFLRKTERIPVPHREVVLMLVFLVFLVLSVPMSRWPGGSVAVLVDAIFKVYIIFFMLVFVMNSVARVRWLLFILVTSGALLEFITIYLERTGGGVVRAGRLMLPGLAGDPNDRALVFVFLLPMAFSLLSETRSTIWKLYYLGIVVTLVWGVVHTYSRGGLVGLAAVIGWFCLRMFPDRKLLVILLLGFALVGLFFAPERVFSRAYSIFDADYDETGSRGARVELLRQGVRIMLANPVAGVGLGMFTVAQGMQVDHTGEWKSPHNTFIEVGAENGIPALVIYLCMYWVMYKNYRRIQRNFGAVGIEPSLRELVRGLEISLVGFLVCSFFLNQAYTWYFYYLLGLSGAFRRIAWKAELRHPEFFEWDDEDQLEYEEED